VLLAFLLEQIDGFSRIRSAHFATIENKVRGGADLVGAGPVEVWDLTPSSARTSRSSSEQVSCH